MTTISANQIRAVQIARRQAGLDEDTYRAKLGRFGVVSTKDLTAAQAGQILDELNGRQSRIEGRYASIARALWIAGWNLGVLRERTDQALLAFIKRQTGIQSLVWLRDPIEGTRVIEALKSWIARESGLDWSSDRNPKRVVLDAIVEKLQLTDEAWEELWARLQKARPLADWDDRDFDEAARITGAMLRKMKGVA